MPDLTLNEVNEIIAAHPACTTAPNGTGSRCTCAVDCANYWIRAMGRRAENRDA